MSNKFLIPIIIVLSLITIGVASITQLNKAPGKIGMNSNQSSEINSSVKTQVVSSSSSIQTNSSSAISSIQNIVESVVAVNSVKAESQPVVSNTAKCNLPESENLVKTGDGCFTLSIGGRMQGENLVSETEMKFLKQYFLSISKDYYTRIFNKFVSNQHDLRMDYTTKITENQFEILIGMSDGEYFMQKYGNAPGDYEAINQAKYSIVKNIKNNTWSYQFIQFEN